MDCIRTCLNVASARTPAPRVWARAKWRTNVLQRPARASSARDPECVRRSTAPETPAHAWHRHRPHNRRTRAPAHLAGAGAPCRQRSSSLMARTRGRRKTHALHHAPRVRAPARAPARWRAPAACTPPSPNCGGIRTAPRERGGRAGGGGRHTPMSTTKTAARAASHTHAGDALGGWERCGCARACARLPVTRDLALRRAGVALVVPVLPVAPPLLCVRHCHLPPPTPSPSALPHSASAKCPRSGAVVVRQLFFLFFETVCSLSALFANGVVSSTLQKSQEMMAERTQWQ